MSESLGVETRMVGGLRSSREKAAAAGPNAIQPGQRFSMLMVACSCLHLKYIGHAGAQHAKSRIVNALAVTSEPYGERRHGVETRNAKPAADSPV